HFDFRGFHRTSDSRSLPELIASLHALGADHLAWQRSGVPAVHVNHFTVDDRVVDTLRRHHEAGAAARQVANLVLAHLGVDLIEVEDHPVSGHTWREPSAPHHTENVGGIRRHQLDRALEAEELLFAHPMADHVGGIAGFAMRIDVRTAVG